ncbi:MAG TPA: hypothetical protein VGB06_09165 [Solirubrobacterales bacterium]
MTPSVLPRGRLAPVGFHGRGQIATADKSHPSALREAVLHVDRHVAFEVGGLPTCGYRRLSKLPSAEARRACRTAIVGMGRAWFEVAYPEISPLIFETDTTLFNNGSRDGATRLLLHGHFEIPKPHALIARIELRPAPRAHPGWIATVKVPRAEGGYGSLVDFELEVGREFHDDAGRSREFVSARCPDGKFELETPKALFVNEANVPGIAPRTILKGSLLLPCKPAG